MSRKTILADYRYSLMEKDTMVSRLAASSRYFVVEGNIGVGKSTFLNIIKKRLNIPVVYEPTHRWQNVGGNENLLEKFYSDTQRWAYTFQTYAFITRILEQEKHASTHSSPLQVLERSVFSDRYCFAKNCHELGAMSLLEWNMYQEWFSWLVENYLPKPAGFIYLACTPETSYARLKKRNRSEEVGVTLEYLHLLNQKHKDWLIDKKDVAPYIRDVPVLVLDCSIDFENDKDVQEQFLDQIMLFMGQHYGFPIIKQPMSMATLTE